MPKGSARNMQRHSIKAAVGMAREIEGGIKQPPAIVQLHRMEVERLARIRYAFEIEQRIAARLEAGGNVGDLRELLQGVRNGTVEVPRGSARPRPTSISSAPRGEPRKAKGRAARLYRSDREVEADLADLGRGKLTMTGVAAVKGMLERFDRELVESALVLKSGFLDKVLSSAVYVLAPPLAPEDGLALVDVLQKRTASAEGSG